MEQSNGSFIDPDIVKKKLYQSIRKIQSIASMVFVCLLEKRNYNDHKNQRWAANATYYNKLAKSINKGLTRNAKRLKFRCLDLVGGSFDDRKADGVHFTREGTFKVYQRMKSAVAKYQKYGN